MASISRQIDPLSLHLGAIRRSLLSSSSPAASSHSPSGVSSSSVSAAAGGMLASQNDMDDNASASEVRKHITQRQWQTWLNNSHLDKEQVNRIVMDFLVSEGYSEAVETFEEESGMDCKVPHRSVNYRDQVKRSIEKGDIAKAMDTLNEFDKNILQNNPKIHFKLQQQQLVELIRQNKTREALMFSQSELASKADETDLPALEKIMTLLVYPTDKQPPEDLNRFLQDEQRGLIANELNKAILQSHDSKVVPALHQILKLLQREQKQLAVKLSYPKIFDFGAPRFIIEHNHLQFGDTESDDYQTEMLCYECEQKVNTAGSSSHLQSSSTSSQQHQHQHPSPISHHLMSPGGGPLDSSRRRERRTFSTSSSGSGPSATSSSSSSSVSALSVASALARQIQQSTSSSHSTSGSTGGGPQTTIRLQQPHVAIPSPVQQEEEKDDVEMTHEDDENDESQPQQQQQQQPQSQQQPQQPPQQQDLNFQAPTVAAAAAGGGGGPERVDATGDDDEREDTEMQNVDDT